MLRIARTLVVFALISAIVLSGCAQEEDPYGTMYDPRDALTEKLQLTEEQVAIVETGTGILPLTSEQVDIIRDPVEQLLSELEPLLDGTRWQEVEDIFERLLTQGEADLEALVGIAEDLQELEPAGEVEVITELEKVSGGVSSSGQIHPLAAGSSIVTTVYTPWGTPPEIDEGDEHINFGWTGEERIGPGEPNGDAFIESEIGGLHAFSWSWIGCDRAIALLGIEFEVPADNTDVSITTTMKYITATISYVAGFAGTQIATRFADEPGQRYETIDSPLEWQKLLELLCLVFSPFVRELTYLGVVTDAGGTVLAAMDYLDLLQAMNQMEPTEEAEVVYSAGPLDKGHYRFYVGLLAWTNAAIAGFAHSAAYGQINKIEVTQTQEEEPPGCPWPMFQHDPQRTGRSPYLGPETPEVKWSFNTECHAGSPSIGADGTIYVGSSLSTSESCKFYAVNPDGTEKWNLSSEDISTWRYPTISTSGTIYASSHVRSSYACGGHLHAINPDGNEKWNLSIPAWNSASVTGAEGTVYTGSACYEGRLYAVNPHGAVNWSRVIVSGGWVSTPTIGIDGTIFARCRYGNLHAVNTDGTRKWSLGGIGGIGSHPVVGPDGTVYVGSSDGSLYAIDPSGTKKWNFITGGAVDSVSIGSGDIIYANSEDGNLYAIDPEGDLEWSFSVGSGASYPLTDASGVVYVSANGKVYAINASGTEKWSLAIGYTIPSSSLALGYDGILYLGSYDKKLFAIGQQAP